MVRNRDHYRRDSGVGEQTPQSHCQEGTDVEVETTIQIHYQQGIGQEEEEKIQSHCQREVDFQRHRKIGVLPLGVSAFHRHVRRGHDTHYSSVLVHVSLVEKHFEMASYSFFVGICRRHCTVNRGCTVHAVTDREAAYIDLARYLLEVPFLQHYSPSAWLTAALFRKTVLVPTLGPFSDSFLDIRGLPRMNLWVERRLFLAGQPAVGETGLTVLG